MAFNIKGITVKIGGDTTDLTKKLNAIKAETKGLDSSMSRLERSMRKVDGGNFRSMATYQDMVKMKMESLTKQINVAKNALSQMDKTSYMYKEKSIALNSEIASMENRLKYLSKGFISTDQNILKTVYSLDKTSSALHKVSQGTKTLSLLSGGTILGATAAAVSFEDAWTGVLKTVDGTPQQLEKINNGIKELATSTSSSYENIAHFAELAGQMGVATDATVGFTETIVKLNDTTNLLGDEAAQQVAKFANIMIDTDKQSNEYFSRLGSAIVDLGNNFATTEADIMNMSMRLATAGRQVGFTSQDVLGLATALSSVGIEATAGGGSISKMLKTIELAVATNSEELQAFSTVSGISAQEFITLWGEDAPTAFGKLLEGISKSENITKTLSDLGIKEVRMSNAMGALAQNTDLYWNAINKASSAFELNSAMTEEADKRYSTLKSSLIQTWEAIKQVGNELGQSFIPTVKKVNDGIKDAAKWFSNLDDGTKQNIANMIMFGAAISPVTFGLSKVASGINTIIKLGVKGYSASAKLVSGLSKVTDGIKSIYKSSTNGHKALSVLADKMGLIEGAAINGKVTLASFSKALISAHPYATLLAGVMTVGAGAAMYFKNATDELTKSIQEEMLASNASYAVAKQVIDGYEEYTNKVNSLKEANDGLVYGLKENKLKSEGLMSIIEDLNSRETLSVAQKSMLAKCVEKLNRLYPELNLQIDQNTGKLSLSENSRYKNIEAIREHIKALQEEAEVQAVNKMVENNAEALAETTLQYENQKQAIIDLAKEYNQLNDAFADSGYSNLEIQARLKEQGTELETLQEQYSKTTDKMIELQSQQALYENYLETKDYSTLGNGLIEQLKLMEQTAADTGWKIPKEIAQALSNPESIGSVQTACNLLATMTNFQGLIDKSGLFGGMIPQSVANGIINNAGTLQGGIDAMNNMIRFINLANTAHSQGKEITLGTAKGMAEDAGFVGDSANKLAEQAVKSFGGKANDLPKKAKEKDKEMARVFDNSSVPGSVGRMGTNMERTLNSHLNSMVSNASKSAASIKNSISGAQRYANSHPVTVQKVTKTMPSSLNSLDMNLLSRRGPDVQIRAPYEVTQTVMAENTMRNVSRIDYTQGLSNISRKLEQFISTFNNTKFMIQLQPQTLDGEVITDKVTEIISIREMLNNVGKGIN